MVPEFLTPKQVAHLAKKPLAEIEEQVASGRLESTERGIRSESVAHLLVLTAYLPTPGLGVDDRVQGETRQTLEIPCHLCGAPTIDYRGTEVLEGSIEFVHLVHTEVRDDYECTDCGATWSRDKFL
jgi:hypothetical protein